MAKKTLPGLRSSAPVVFHIPEMPAPGVPARDLNAADLEYLARRNALQVSGGQRIPAVTAEDLAAIADELVASGAFSKSKPKSPAAPAEES